MRPEESLGRRLRKACAVTAMFLPFYVLAAAVRGAWKQVTG
jgi:hypothetical protein